MTKKKSPTPAKVATRKKESKPTWKQTGEASIPGIGTIKNFSVKFDEDTKPSAQDILDAVTAENYALKTLLSKHQSEPMQQTVSPQRATMLSQFAEQLDGQLSRLYNSLNTLDTLANRLLIQKEDAIQGNAPEAHDLSTKYGNLLTYFSNQNDRLDFLNTKLSDLI